MHGVIVIVCGIMTKLTSDDHDFDNSNIVAAFALKFVI